MTSRPPLIWSSVAVSSARRSGCVNGSTCTAVPNFILVVRAATAASTVIGADITDRAACWWISASQKESKPYSSDSTA